MELAEFKASLSLDQPPPELAQALEAMWHEAKGDWAKAHTLAQAQNDNAGAWVHAYLHRVEGNRSNAGYWYHRAGKPRSSASLADEWDEIVGALL